MPIEIHQTAKETFFFLQGNTCTYLLSAAADGTVGNLHWGAKLVDPADIPSRESLQGRRTSIDDRQECRAWGGSSRITPTLKITYPDEVRAAFLQYQSHTVNGERLEIVTADPFYPLTVRLCYRVCPAFDIIERHIVVENHGGGDVVLEQAYAATWHLPTRDTWRLTYLAGAYNREFQLYREILQPGRKVLESRTGLTGQDSTPFFLLDEGCATETTGEVYYGALVWSGNWQLIIEKDSDFRTMVTGGENAFDFAYCLEPGQCWESPVFLGGYTARGFGDATRKLHRYERAEIIHPTERDRILPVIYNTHGSLVNATCEENVMREIELAHEHGIELFVLDGGWSGWDPVDSPVNGGQAHRLGYGSWEVNRARFPHGLKLLADTLHGYGMKFGLWMEPETVFCTNPVAQAHPEWLMGYDGREPELSYMKTYSLNMANDDACDYITNVMLKLVRENDIDYIKNDFNRYMLHMGWRGVESKHKKEVGDKYVRNMWKCYMRLKEEFPDLIFENSAGGGKRADLGMLRFSGRMHRSDNQDPLDSVRMHEGMSYFIPPKFEGGACFISDEYGRLVNDRYTTMEYQAHVAMLSDPSVSLKFAELEPERREELKRLLALNLRIRSTVQLGEFYRLVSVYEKDYGVYQYLEPDKSRAVVFILGQNLRFGLIPERLRLQDLDPDAKYRVTGFGTFPKSPHASKEERAAGPDREKDYGILTGRGLMNAGIRFELKGHATSQILLAERI